MKAEAARRPRLVWAVGVVVMVLAGLAGLGIFLAKQPYGFDLWAYVLAGRHLLTGEPLYSAEPQMPAGPFGEYHYAPIVAAPFALLAPLPFWLATVLWIGLNTGIAAAMGVHLIRPLPRDARPWAAAAFVLFLPTILEISLGNINLITVALCLVAWSLRRRPAISGALLAVAIGAKLLPLLLAPFYLAAGRGRVVAWTLAAGAAGMLLNTILFWREMPGYVALFVALLGSNQTAEFIANTGPPEVAGFLGSPIGRWLLPAVAVATAIVGGLSARRLPDHETHLHHLALAFAPYLSLFGLLWFPYLVFALPALASSFHRALLFPHPLQRGVLVSALALSWFLMQIVGEAGDAMPFAAHLAGLLILLAVALAVLAHPDRIRITESVKTRATA